MKKIKNNIKESKKILIISLCVIVFVAIILLYIKLSTDYSDINLKVNNKEIFTINDLKVNNLKFGSNEKEVKKELGKPKKEKTYVKDVYKYKDLAYNGIKVTLREDYDDFILIGVDISKRKYKISRNIKVGDNIKSVMKKFKVTNKTGNYIYGNYTVEALKQVENKENIYFGLRTKSQVMYINRDRIDSNLINTAELNIKYDNGNVSNIKWSYDLN